MAGRRGRAAWAAALALLLGAGCDLEPEVGPLVAPACDDADSDPETPVSFRADLLEGVFADRCLACHDPASSRPLGVAIGGLDLTSYATVRQGGVNSGVDIVIASSPCASVLHDKLLPGPPFGSQMPLGGPPFLDAAQLQLIRDWIAEGARDN